MIPLIVIPARGGSKGLPKKNIKLLNKKPLIHYTIEAARKIFEDRFIFVSTDSNEIKSVCEQTGLKVPFLRPDYLSTDISSTEDVIHHALKYFILEYKIEPDCIILLQPTSPFRNTKHISEALKLFNKNLDMVVSVKKTKSNPYYVLYEENKIGFLTKSKTGDFSRRQDCPRVWELNGAIYIINTKALKEKKIRNFKKLVKYEMNQLDSLDIDDELDFEFSEYKINKNI